MAYCTKCGAQMGDQVVVCPQCGTASAAAAPARPSEAGAGLSENVAGALCYVLGWLTGIVFLLIDKRSYVRFHAAQSLVVFGALHVLRVVLGLFFGIGVFAGGWHMLGPGMLVLHLISIVALVLWIVLMIKAYQGERFQVPVAAEIAEGIAGK